MQTVEYDEWQVSWLRHRDTHLLTAGRYTYTSDQRFRAIHKVLSEDYILQIQPVQVAAAPAPNLSKLSSHYRSLCKAAVLQS